MPIIAAPITGDAIIAFVIIEKDILRNVLI
jgi:hypothetical protein